MIKKQTKKYIAKFFLSIFVFNILVIPRNKSIVIPISIPAPTVEALAKVGSSIAGAIGAYLFSKNDCIPDFIAPTPSKKTIDTTNKIKQIPNGTPSITKDIIKDAVKVEKPIPTHTQSSKTTQIETVRTYVDSLIKSSSKTIANKTLKKIIENTSTINPSVINPELAKPAFETFNIPYGIRCQTVDRKKFVSTQFSNKSISYLQKMALVRYCKDLHTLRHEMRQNATYRNMVLNDAQHAIDKLTKTQTGNLDERIIACMDIDKIYIQAPIIMEEYVKVVQELKKIYFHRDGSLCLDSFYRNTNASSIITKFIDQTSQQLGKSVSRNQIINPSLYQQLKSIRASSHTADKCKNTYRRWNHGEKFNSDLISLINACRNYDLKKARNIQQQYPASQSLKNIVDTYQDQYNKAYKKIYNKQGIIKIAKNDPAYITNKHRLYKASDTDKEIINQNLLIRHHLKEKMHQNWHIPHNAPSIVHEAMYNILGTDASALSDTSLLQKRIERIIDNASETDYEYLINAFYEPNGILKEIAFQLPKTEINTPEKILSPSFAPERHTINELLCNQLKYPNLTTKTKEATQQFEYWLKATNRKEMIAAKAAFFTLCKVIAKQKQKIKYPSQKQTYKIVDANSSAPIPPDPELEPEPEKDSKKDTTEIANTLKCKPNNESVVKRLKSLLNSGKRIGNRVENMIDKNTKIQFRKDFGKNAHELTQKRGYPKGVKIDHYNIDIQIRKRPGTNINNWKIFKRWHIVTDSLGNVTDFY